LFIHADGSVSSSGREDRTGEEHAMIWKEKRVLLIILGLLLAANTIYFFTYRVRYQSRLDDREAELTQKQEQLEQAHIARLRAERRFQNYQQIEHDVNLVFDEHWATQ